MKYSTYSKIQKKYETDCEALLKKYNVRWFFGKSINTIMQEMGVKDKSELSTIYNAGDIITKKNLFLFKEEEKDIDKEYLNYLKKLSLNEKKQALKYEFENQEMNYCIDLKALLHITNDKDLIRNEYKKWNNK